MDVQLSIKSSHDSCDTQRGVEISEQSWSLYFINRESTVSLSGPAAAMGKDLERREKKRIWLKAARFPERCSETIGTRPDEPVAFSLGYFLCFRYCAKTIFIF